MRKYLFVTLMLAFNVAGQDVIAWSDTLQDRSYFEALCHEGIETRTLLKRTRTVIIPENNRTRILRYFEIDKKVRLGSIDLINGKEKEMEYIQENSVSNKIISAISNIGHTLVYSIDRELFIIGVGKLLRLNEDCAGLSFSPNDEKLLIICESSKSQIFDVFVYDIKSSKFLKTNESSSSMVSWLNSSNLVVTQPAANGEVESVYKLDLDTRKKELLHEGRNPVCSPDGNFIAFVSCKGKKEVLMIYNVRSKEAFQVMDNIDLYPSLRRNQYLWSSDGEKLAVILNEPVKSDGNASLVGGTESLNYIYLYNIEQKKSKKIFEGSNVYQLIAIYHEK